MRTLLLIFMLAAFAMPAQAGEVVATIKPLHSLVAGVMAGDDRQPLLLVEGNASPHTFALRPSQVRAVENADIVFYMGHSFETFLAKVLDGAKPGVVRVPMEQMDGVTRYALRFGAGFESHGHDDDEASHHGEGGFDIHLWMSPANARRMVEEIAARLSERYPGKKDLYRFNAQALSARLDALDGELQEAMRPLNKKPFIVFHDAYQYFERAYGLNNAGSITVRPDQPPGVRHLSEIREKIRATGAACVFREPQFDTRVVDNLLAGTEAKGATLDPLGADLMPGPELYFDLMRNLAKGFRDCLA